MKKTLVSQLLATDLENQHAYVEQLTQQGERGYALIAAGTFVQGMRDSGYKSTATAIDELIDNAFQAGANRIDVISQTADKNISGIAVVDDGHGMEPGMIRAAVLWGGTHRFNDRGGYGRYGFGLPSATVSITEKYEVYSKVKGGDWYKLHINLQDIAHGKLTNPNGLILAPEPVKAKPPAWILNNVAAGDFDSGTIIYLVAPDRLTSGFRKPSSFDQKLMEHLGLIYRGVLRACEMWVNGNKVNPIDPLFLDPNARYYENDNGYKAEALPTTEFKFVTRDGKEGAVRLRYSYMHPLFQRKKDGSMDKARLGVMKDNNGYLIVTRSGRQIDVVTRPHYTKQGDNITIVNYDRNWSIELDFDPVLDEEFGITVNKQQVTLSESVWQKLGDEKLPAMVKALRARFKNDVADLGEHEGEKARTSEEVMQEAAKFLKRAKKPSTRKQEKARQNLEREAQQKAQEEKKPESEVLESLFSHHAEKQFEVNFESLEGAPFFRAEQYGPLVRLWINRRHRFYSDLYATSEATPRVRAALELLLFVLASCELEADGDQELFYQVERPEWSKRLQTVLTILDREHSVDDVESAATEQHEAESAGAEA